MQLLLDEKLAAVESELDEVLSRARSMAVTFLVAAPFSCPCRSPTSGVCITRWWRKVSPKKKAKHGLATSMATDSGKDMGYKGYDPGFGGDTQAFFNELVESVDFLVKFVADLLKAVFDANLTVMKQQTDSYIN